jgi:hypothetical protein
MLKDISEAQRSMLRTAAAREDRLLRLPEKARGVVATTTVGKLIDAGWVKEVKATNGTSVWRKDQASGDAYALKLTAKGLKAAVANTVADGLQKSTAPALNEKAAPKRPGRPVRTAPAREAIGDSRETIPPTAARAPRSGSKIGKVLAKLSTDKGATIGELMTATVWLEHTTRAALTGLRHRGYVLSLSRRERDDASVYRIAAQGGEAEK